jgi:lysophospholipase L1-like esterase
MRQIAWGGTLLAIFALTMEMACRVDDAIRFGTPVLSRVESESDLLVRDADGEHGRPHARYGKWVINNVGMRGPDIDPVKPPGTLRVVTAGASETFGLYESPGQEFPRQLEDTLRARVGPRVEVLNAAIFGMSLPTLEQDLRLRVRALRPDVVVLYPTPVQYLNEETPTPAEPDSAASGRLPFRDALYPRAMERLRKQAKALVPEWLATSLRRDDIARDARDHPAGWRFTSVPADRLAAYDADVRRTIGTIHAIGAAPVLAIHANAFEEGESPNQALLVSWENQYHRATGDALIAFEAAAARATMQAARDSNVIVVDLRRVHATPMFADYAHFTDAGAAVVAGALAPAVLEASR